MSWSALGSPHDSGEKSVGHHGYMSKPPQWAPFSVETSSRSTLTILVQSFFSHTHTHRIHTMLNIRCLLHISNINIVHWNSTTYSGVAERPCFYDHLVWPDQCAVNVESFVKLKSRSTRDNAICICTQTRLWGTSYVYIQGSFLYGCTEYTFRSTPTKRPDTSVTEWGWVIGRILKGKFSR